MEQWEFMVILVTLVQLEIVVLLEIKAELV